jgi:hypothetical protein
LFPERLFWHDGCLYGTKDNLKIRLHFVFPEAEDRPSFAFQLLLYAAVTLNVTADLLAPEIAIALGHYTVLGASVPEAAVYEHRNLCGFENQVRSTDDTGAEAISHAESP